MNSFLQSEKCICLFVGLRCFWCGGYSAALTGGCSLHNTLSPISVNSLLKFNLINMGYKMLDSLSFGFLSSLILHHPSFLAPRRPTSYSLCRYLSELFFISSHCTMIISASRPLRMFNTLSSIFLLTDLYYSFCSQKRCQLSNFLSKLPAILRWILLVYISISRSLSIVLLSVYCHINIQSHFFKYYPCTNDSQKYIFCLDRSRKFQTHT